MSGADLDAIDLQIGRSIRFYRVSRELSQAKLAARIGISYQQLQKYERGINRIPASRLLRTAQALGVPVCDLYESVERMNSPSPVSKGEQAHLLQAYSRIRGPERRRLIVDLLQQLASE